MKKLILYAIALTMLASMLAPLLANAQRFDYNEGIFQQFKGFWSQRPPAPTSDQGGSQKERAVFLKTHGCARASFTVNEVPPAYRVGLFARPTSYSALVRISSDTIPRTPDQKNNTIGFAVKVLGLSVDDMVPDQNNEGTQDFLTQNIDVFFVDKAKDFYEFNEASFKGKFDDYVREHKRTGEILTAMEKPVTNVLGIDYWSTVPYKFGRKGNAKYKFVPCKRNPGLPNEVVPPDATPNYLQQRLERDMLAGGACYELQIQLRNESRNKLSDKLNPEPLDRATVVWDESITKPVTVATVSIFPQPIQSNVELCEKVSFNPFHAMKEHKPVGSISEARGYVYKRMAELRQKNLGAR